MPQRAACSYSMPRMRPVCVEADAIVDAEVVPLAGDDHVVVAVVAALGGPARQLGDQRRGGGRQVALALLAAEAPAHAAHLDRDGVARHAQHVRDLVLDLARVLGGAVDGDVVVLARHGERDLPLQIEVLLPADVDAPFEHMRRGRNGGLGIATLHRIGRLQEGLRLQAWSMVRIAGLSSYSTTARRAAARACAIVSAATANSDWP